MTNPVKKPRIRLTPQERIEQILQAATVLIGRHGYYGLSLQQVADEVGLTQPGLLHYVHTKDGLLRLLVEQGYDHRFDPETFAESGLPGSVHEEGLSFPAYLRFLVSENARTPELIQLYMVLGAESASPEHPAHGYFVNRPDAVWELYSGSAWRLPPEIGGWENMRPLVEMAIAAMDGLQIRLFRAPAIDLEAEWAAFESVLFPDPVWADYR